ncbi:inositol monophosphatase family protein [Oceanospirillum linum]|uniref:Inositol-1-monophosphatase n=1 Tax=Oceanospirillum linum TaxID=966 RepID=A0A1T1H7Y6_OCELI|nr:inositol monophosphatase family protein [Oceanospirillum linum]OOV85886.1 inositol monophosphatase [Oceanospirillum linum]SEG52129.1 myo-inositol-1(or 4)-monophosphatase [Oleiphilus messinensis]SMP35907.1 myo-inositol-1(or 4)-monophosphatase [Oceanospirillum linum]
METEHISTHPELKQYLSQAITIARQAGDLIRSAREEQSFSQGYKAGHELVTSADLKSDQLIRALLQLAFPEHAILSEESSPDHSDASTLYQPIWIIDPIDGTVNYAHGLPQVAISIAYAERGEVKVGVVYNPFLDELFTAVAGEPAQLNGKDIRASETAELKNALIATGFPYDKSLIPTLLPRLHQVLNNCQDIRRMGSAAIDICYVAAGRLDAYYESVSPWDFAAARLIALRAGALAGHLDGCPDHIPPALYGHQILIANPALYPLLQNLLKQNKT